MHRILLPFFTVAIAAGLQAQPGVKRDEPPPETVRLTLRPAAAPVPALKHALLPEAKDLQPGNAATLYFRSFSPEWYWYGRQKEFWDELEKHRTLPLEQLSRDKVGWISSKQLAELDLAARREHCDWELLQRVRRDGYLMLLPDVHPFRTMGQVLAVRARVEMAEGRLDDAIYTLQTGFQIARHISEGPTLIHALVGGAVVTEMCTRVDELIQQPGAPNLYWALTQLPRPFVDLRKPLQGETLMAYSILPHVEELEKRIFSQAEAQALFEAILGSRLHLEEGGATQGVDARAKLLVLTIKSYPGAKRYALAKGLPPDRVGKMPTFQVVMIQSLDEYRRLRDDAFKWQGVPYHEARRGLDEADRQLREAGANPAGLPFGSIIIPATYRVVSASVRYDRRIAALRCIEGIRMHAAANNGRLPQSLAEISIVLLPLDPITGKEFSYRASGDQFVIDSPPPAGSSASGGLRYEVTLKR